MPKATAFNIGNGYVTTFEELTAALGALCSGVKYEVDGQVPASKLAPLDISAAKRHLGWAPQYTIRSAFEDYLAEFKAAREQSEAS
jgi:nucleoside-diphosphate-sugar epimerase